MRDVLLGVAFCLTAVACERPASPGLTGEDDAGAFDLVHALEIDHPDSVSRIHDPDQIRFFPSGQVLLIDRREQHVVVLGHELNPVRTIGGRGGGPGEFQSLVAAVLLPGDSVLAVDGRTRTVTVFTPAGNLARTFVWPAVEGTRIDLLGMVSRVTVPEPVGVTESGRVVVAVSTQLPPPGERTRRLILSGPPDPTPLTLVADVPHAQPFTEGSARWGTVLYSATALAAVRSNQVFIGLTDASDIVVHDLDEGTVRRVPHGIELVPITYDQAEAERERRLAAPAPLPPIATAADARAMWTAAMHRVPPADQMPAYSRMVVDPDGQIWLTRCDPLEPARCRVIVLSDQGRRLADLPLPHGFVLHDVSRDGVIGLTDYEEMGRVIEIRALPAVLRGR